MLILMPFLAALVITTACVQVGPKDEPLHIIVDVNIKVQVDEAVRELWDSVERMAPTLTPAAPEPPADGGGDDR